MHLQKTVKQHISAYLLAAVLLLPGLTGICQSPPNLIFTPVVSTGFSSPLDIINAKDGTNRLFIVERTGKVRIVSGGVLQAGSYLDVHDSLPPGDENGLLSMAFHPDYVNNGYLFIYYLTTGYNIRVTRFRSASPTSNTPVNQTTGVVIMTIPAITTSYHNGGKMLFGPDGNLYFGLGDGSPGGDPDNHAQNGNLLWGKMVRINVDNFTTPPYYTIPPDNPYVNDPNVRDEIFALGLRNPWRWSFDRLNNDMWLPDVGEGAWEEVNYRSFATSGGINYGWRCYEGNADFVTAGCLAPVNYVFPIFDYPHNMSTGGYSIIGGHVYRGNEYAAMYGYYICIDYVSGNAWRIKPNGSGGWTVSIQTGLPTGVVGFGEDEFGVLYAVKLSGILYKVTTNSGGPLPLTLLQFTAKPYTGYNELAWRTANEQDLSHYEIEFSGSGTNYINAGRMDAVNTTAGNSYLFKHFITGFARLFYRLKIVQKDGRNTYSDVITIDNAGRSRVRVYPTLLSSNRLNISTADQVQEILVFSAEGRKVYQSNLHNASGSINILLPQLPNGMYLVRIRLKDEYVTEKIFIQGKN